MLWVLGASSLIGLVLGAVFRAPALALASLVVAAATSVDALLLGLPVGCAAIRVASALAALQVSYLVGLTVSIWARNPRSSRR